MTVVQPPQSGITRAAADGEGSTTQCRRRPPDHPGASRGGRLATSASKRRGRLLAALNRRPEARSVDQGVGRHHPSRWSFPAPGLPCFPHPEHTTRFFDRARGREMSPPPILVLLPLRPTLLLLYSSANRGPLPCTPCMHGGQGNRRHFASSLPWC